MTPDERKMLQDLADKIAQTPAPPKDAEAEEFIRTRIGNRPDALYLMTQTVLIQNLALEQAQRQIQQLQQSGSQPASGGSFLGQQSAPRGQQYAAPPPPQYAPPQSAYAPPSPSEPPSFLRGAAQTAAGVAAGALAFEGIRSLFSHPGYGYGGLGGFGGGGFVGAPPVEETVVNNYYDDPNANNNVQDVQDQYEDNQQLDNVDYDTGDNGGFDDNSGGGGDDFV